jgi:ferrous iron transport protein A
MEAGQIGIVTEILGGQGFTRRLQVLGIRPSKKITKVSSMFMRGPATIQVDGTQVAIGFGMANKILVSLGN